jgi:3-oxoadipate enol-lactonase
MAGNAVAVHHVVTGPADAPVVVLSNSMGADLRMWDAQVDALAEHFRVVRYDTRGHGQSPVPDGPYSMDDLADDVIALIDTLGVEKAHVVGPSLGGMTGIRLAARNPDRVDAMVLLCTAAFLEVGPAYTERAAQVRAQGTAVVAEGVVSRWFTPAYLEEIANGVQDGRLLVVPEAAHLAVAEQPGVITPAIIEHLQGRQS